MKNNYKQGDKVVVELTESDVTVLNKGFTMAFYSEQLLGKLEDFQPTKKKIKMTIKEKKEFDELVKKREMLDADLNDFFDAVWDYPQISPILHERLFENKPTEINREKQIEFAWALDDPSLIEVIKPEHEFKVGDLVKVKTFGVKAIIFSTTPPFDNQNDNGLVKVLYTNGSDEWIASKQLEFIKSNVINWED